MKKINNNSVIIGQRLRYIRENICLSIDEASKLLNIDKEELTKIENGEKEIMVKDLILFAKNYHCDTTSILEETEKRF